MIGDEVVKSEIFMFYYCISYMKKDKNGKSMITDFSQIKVSDLTVESIKREINNLCDDNCLFVLLLGSFFPDCRTDEEHEQCFQNVLVERKKRIIAAYSKVVL